MYYTLFTFLRILNATIEHHALGMEGEVLDVFSVNPTNDIIKSGVTKKQEYVIMTG